MTVDSLRPKIFYIHTLFRWVPILEHIYAKADSMQLSTCSGSVICPHILIRVLCSAAEGFNIDISSADAPIAWYFRRRGEGPA